ncbi:MAG: TIGR00282 family metallophosphoesterase [Candidatus Peregrinibacteria bacterium]|nr:TIGR00282 family metallophosphoesterase [Candidatus Peregrinibacteria bacterium]
MKILFIGDIIGKPGREATAKILPDLKRELKVSFVIANGENLSQGKGINTRHAQEMQKIGIDFFTTGNHVWRQSDIFPIMDKPDTFVIRPANYPDSNPGRGYQIVQTDMMKKILIINLQGRVFVREDTDCPFRKLDQILEETKSEKPEVIFIDFHAEATSEKVCLGLYAADAAERLGVTVGALVGTHTHVPTADETILYDQTAYITDAGSVGLKNSAIGVDPESVIKNFLTQMPVKHTITPGGPVIFNSVLITFEGGRATAIERVQREVKT